MSTSSNYKTVTVDVPEERVAEFHAFFARFLAGRGRRGRHGGPRHGMHGRHRCAERRESAEHGASTGQSAEYGATGGQPAEITEV